MSYKDDFIKNGYVVIRNCLTRPEIVEINRHTTRIFEHWFSLNKAYIAKHQMVNMHALTDTKYFTKNSDERVQLFNAISPSHLVNCVEGIFGMGIYLHNTQLFFNPINKSKRPYWHRDMQYSDIPDAVQAAEQNNMTSLHLRIPLIKEQGVELIPGSHKSWDTPLQRDVRLELNGRKNHETLPNAELITLNVGDVLIFSAQMLHRGNYELNKERKALDLCIGKPNPFTLIFLDQELLPTPNELAFINSKQWFILDTK